MSMEDKKSVIVFGTGLSGISAANLLAGDGKDVILYDSRESVDTAAFKSKIKSTVKIMTGKQNTGEMFKNCEMLVTSPGIAMTNEVIVAAKKAGIPVIGELELASRYFKGKVIAITGTNGKTTTTSLVGEMVKRMCKNTYVLGNIGIPFSCKAKEAGEDSIAVVEVSSFQLESIDSFHPKVSVILNITPDHMDRHHTMEAYAEAKFRIAENQTEEDFCVLNYDDERLKSFAKKIKAQVVWFGRINRPENGFYLEDGRIFKVKGESKEKILDVKELQILGNHNYENVMAAFAAADAMGVPLDAAAEAAKAFKGVAHRIEYVDSIAGVKYYNDSKGTNPDAAIKAVCAIDDPIILIAGGYDKNSEYDLLMEKMKGRVKEIILLGETGEKMADCAKKHGFKNVKKVKTLKEAVEAAHSDAAAGDVVLLSPACASWDMFKNYEERGDLFKEYVRALA